MPRPDHIKERDKVVFIDEMGDLHEARVTHVWGEPDQKPTINLRIIGADVDRTSVQHRSRTDAPGFYWTER